MPASAAEVSLEHREPVIVLLLRSVRLAEFTLKYSEMMVGVEQLVIAVAVVHHLTDQGIVAIQIAAVDSGGITTRRNDEERGEKKEGEA